MITQSFSTHALLDQKGQDALVLFVTKDNLATDELKRVENDFFPGLHSLLSKQKFTGAAGSSITVQMHKDGQPVQLFIIGLGAQPATVEQYRRACGSAIRLAERMQCTKLAIKLPQAGDVDADVHAIAKETAIIVRMAAYYFDHYLAEKKQLDFDITFVSTADQKVVQAGFAEGEIIGDAVNEARFWIDAPAELLNPLELASYAHEIAKKHNLKVTEFKEADIIRMGMGGLAAVSKGSDRDCHLVILEYRTEVKDAPTLAFVGKGITFDSGGLSIKPAQHMETMKEDMSGAAAVLAAVDALSHLKPKVNVLAVMPISENLPSGKATKPGDIIRFYNGVTAEVRNTDAEGRLILADALAYTVKHYKPDAIIDVATLTGACSYALGPFFTGMMSQHKELSDRVQTAADRTGDRVWPLPFDDDYKVAVKSKIADICNIGSSKYRAGAITAGFFLQHFVGDTPWVHLDIAGTAYDVPDISYYRDGATGAAIRLLIDVARNWQA
jgi:leucyl aminopeptidase